MIASIDAAPWIFGALTLVKRPLTRITHIKRTTARSVMRNPRAQTVNTLTLPPTQSGHTHTRRRRTPHPAGTPRHRAHKGPGYMYAHEWVSHTMRPLAAESF